jgi:uncharacterized protein (TIGR02996 family)
MAGPMRRVDARLERRVRREFFPEDCDQALGMLRRWDTTACAPGEAPGRMHRAVLDRARGSVAGLRRAIAVARVDFRDVLIGPLRDRTVAPGPDEPAPGPDEEAFLRAIRAKPPDLAPRLAYADWLADRGDQGADYARVLCEWLAGGPTPDATLIDRERTLRAGLGPGWLARVRGMRVWEPRERVRRPAARGRRA